MNPIVAIALIFGLSVGLVALLVLCNALFAGIVERSKATVEHMPIRSFLVGLLNFAFFGLISAGLLGGDGGAQMIGLLIASVLLSFVALGLAATARLAGQRLRPADMSPTRQVIAGAATLLLAASVPLVGWLVVPALAGLSGYGALIIALVGRERAALAARRPAPTGRAAGPGE
ncbi:MAG: hypothetical protein U0Z44_20380 [Kouleothrix sp.]|jgi:hypothetical protein|nr:hypothetical protein [Kouleothrix sp.]